MIYLNLEDGLGNQLFEYAFARSIQEMYDEDIIISRAQFDLKAQVHPKMRNALNAFNITDRVKIVDGIQGKLIRWWILGIHWMFRLICFPIRSDKELACRFANFFGLYYDFTGMWRYCKPLRTGFKAKLITGRFQSDKYFSTISDKITKELKIIKPLSDSCNRLINEVMDNNSVAVHIRRGDYLKDSHKGLQICNEKYYFDSINYLLNMTEKPIFYIFSGSIDDINWIKNNYTFPSDAIIRYVDCGFDAIEDFAIMKSCKNFIIANSSYSWWAQNLSSNDNKIVVAPEIWNDDGIYDKDVYQKNWKKMSIERR